MFHRCDYEAHDSIAVKVLKKDNRQLDSLLQLYLGDITWRVRVKSGMEKDTMIKAATGMYQRPITKLPKPAIYKLFIPAKK